MHKNANCLFASLLEIAVLFGVCAAASAAPPMVSMGDSHGLALQADGTVLAWGSDTYGQLGVGRPLISTVPVKVSGLSNVISIAGGSAHTLAVRQDGTVWAWGANEFGQLGDGSTTDRSSPVQVAGVADAVVGCAGGWHSAVLKQDGTVWTWGNNWYGQAGNGTISTSSPPGPVTGLSGVTKISCFANQTVALLQDGTLRAWGENTNGDLGDGTTIHRSLPVRVSGLGNVVAINNVTALKEDGTLWEWGYTEHGPILIPVPLAGIDNALVLGISYGGGYGVHLEAIKSDLSTLWRWGTGSTPAVQAPLGTLQAVASSPGHTVLLKADGTVVATGLNTSGQLGNGIPPSGGFDWQGDFLPVVGLANVAAVAVGDSHSLALDANGNVWAWGDDAHGQLGRGATLSNTVPSVVPGLSNIVQVSAAGGGTSLAVDGTGNVWTWGLNYHQQLGDGTSTNRSAPVRLSRIKDVQAVAVGATWTSMALKRDGTVWTWGNNGFGQLGNGTTGCCSGVPAQVPGLANVTAIAAHTFHMLAVRQDGTVWAWGDNAGGELGLGTTTTSLVPAEVTGLSAVTSVASTYERSFAVKADGTVMAWGLGGLGDGTWRYNNGQSTPIPVPGLANVVELSASTYHTLARRSDGSVWGWGDGRVGSALGSGASSLFPTPIAIPDAIQGISASQGPGSSALLALDGLLHMGGGNSSGQLADGTFAQHPDFVLAVSPGLNGYLNLSTGSSVDVPLALRVPFFVAAVGGITDASAEVSTTTQFNAADVGKSGAVYVTARVPLGSLGGSSQPLGAVGVRKSAMQRLAAVTPSAKAAANTASPSPVLMQLTPSGWQPVTNGQLIPYASGVLGDQLAAQTILNGTDTTNLKGAEFCLGYGTSAAEMGAAGRMRTVATIPDPNATGTTSIGCLPLPIPTGWNLLGNGLNQTLAVPSLYGDATWVNSVWKWDATQMHWQFYAPLMDATTLQSFTSSKGYGILSTIEPGEGYWVNATAPGSVLFESGSPYTLSSANLVTGWNLVATGATTTPSTFNTTLSATPPAAGSVPNNVVSLWTWDNANTKWYFYAPSLEAQGGTVLTDYVTSHGYRDFSLVGKTLGLGVGFWVNR